MGRHPAPKSCQSGRLTARRQRFKKERQLSKGTVTLGLSAEDADATHGLAVVGCFGINKIESSTSRPTWSRVMVSLSEQATCTELVGLLVTFVRRAHLQ